MVEFEGLKGKDRRDVDYLKISVYYDRINSLLFTEQGLRKSFI